MICLFTQRKNKVRCTSGMMKHARMKVVFVPRNSNLHYCDVVKKKHLSFEENTSYASKRPQRLHGK